MHGSVYWIQHPLTLGRSQREDTERTQVIQGAFAQSNCIAAIGHYHLPRVVSIAILPEK